MDWLSFLLYYVPMLILPSIFTALAIAIHKLDVIGYFTFKMTEEEKKVHAGGDFVAKVLKEHGVKYVFTLCGGHISPILASCEKFGLRVIDTRHEVTAVFAADAVARLSGVIGVACVTAGPGVTNTITAVKNAQMAQIPILILGGAAPTLLQGRGALQDIDHLSLFKSLCKYSASVRKVRDVVPTLRKAIAVAQSNVPGPCFLELPIDVLYSFDMLYSQFCKRPSKSGFLDRIFMRYIESRVFSVHSDAWRNTDFSPLPVSVPMPTTRDVDAAVRYFCEAKRPVILVGSQALLPPTAATDIRKSLEALGVPCFLAGMARGLLGRRSPFHIRQRRRDALKEADVVILAGIPCDFRLEYGRALSRKSKIIAVNRDYEHLTKNSPSLWKATLAIQADAGSFLVSLPKKMPNYTCSPDWLQKLQERDLEKEKANRLKSKEPCKKHMNPLQILYHTEEMLDDDSVIVVDGGDFVGSAAYIVRPRGPLNWLDPGAFGTLGVGGGFALGAKLCRPDSEIWVVYGDGSLGYSVAEFDTFTRHKLPVIALIGNDAGWTQIAREQVPIFNSSVGCDLDYCDYDKVAEGFGGAGLVLKDASDEEIVAVLSKAKAIAKTGKPVLINALIGKSDFREEEDETRRVRAHSKEIKNLT